MKIEKKRKCIKTAGQKAASRFHTPKIVCENCGNFQKDKHSTEELILRIR